MGWKGGNQWSHWVIMLNDIFVKKDSTPFNPLPFCPLPLSQHLSLNGIFALITTTDIYADLSPNIPLLPFLIFRSCICLFLGITIGPTAFAVKIEQNQKKLMVRYTAYTLVSQ